MPLHRRPCVRSVRGGDAQQRLPDTAHNDRPWRIHAHPRFRLEDACAADAGRASRTFPGSCRRSPPVTPRATPPDRARPLLVRRKLGECFGWDDPEKASLQGCRRSATAAGGSASTPARTGVRRLRFDSLYLLEDESPSAESANKTSTGSSHPRAGSRTGRGGTAARSVCSRNDLTSRAHMAAIRPFADT